MYFKLLIIITSIICSLNAQSYYESTFGIQVDSYSAQSLSIGSSSHVIERSGFGTSINPSNKARCHDAWSRND